MSPLCTCRLFSQQGCWLVRAKAWLIAQQVYYKHLLAFSQQHVKLDLIEIRGVVNIFKHIFEYNFEGLIR